MVKALQSLDLKNAEFLFFDQLCSSIYIQEICLKRLKNNTVHALWDFFSPKAVWRPHFKEKKKEKTHKHKRDANLLA